jgi:hypothetical protein
MLLGISQTLRQYLLAAIPDASVKIGTVADLQAGSVDETLVLVLYQIEEVGNVRAAPARLPTETTEPVALTLQYLITSPAQDAGDSQQSLSQVLEAFHNHPVFTESDLHSTISTRVSRLTIQLRSTPQEELRNLWTAFRTPMHLSLYYEVNAQPSAS